MYGNRYENLGQNVSGGGQGDVLRVRDTLDPLKTEYALKRSGGGLIAREQLNSAEFDAVFTKGERGGLPLMVGVWTW
jgi:hypothetical protein